MQYSFRYDLQIDANLQTMCNTNTKMENISVLNLANPAETANYFI